MLNTNMMLFDDLTDFSGLTTEKTKQLKQLLVSNNCLKRRKNFFVKTPEFIKLLKEMNKREEKK